MGIVPLRKTIGRVVADERDDEPAAIEAEFVGMQESIAQRREATARLATDWLHAATADEAATIDAERRELLRTIKRDESTLPLIEQRLAVAKAAAMRQAVRRHRNASRDAYQRLKAAIDAAAAAQVAAIRVREAAVAELGETATNAAIPHIAFRGLLLPDLVQIWAAELDRAFAAPEPAKPAPAPPAATKLASPPAGPKAAPRAAKPARAPRHDPPPADGERAVVLVRAGVELSDGTQSMTGDRINLLREQAERLVMEGAADFAPAG